MRYFILIIMSAIFPGCSAIDARSDNGIGHAYIATEESIDTATVTTAVAAEMYFVPLLITIPLNFIDIVFSLTTDTVLLPFDLFIEPKNPKRDATLIDGI